MAFGVQFVNKAGLEANSNSKIKSMANSLLVRWQVDTVILGKLPTPSSPHSLIYKRGFITIPLLKDKLCKDSVFTF